MNADLKKQTDLNLLQSALIDDFNIHCTNLSRLTEIGDHSEAFSADLESQKIIIKVIASEHERYAVEAASLELLAKHGIPVAKPLGYRHQAKYLDKAVLIQTAVPGVLLDYSEQGSRSEQVHQQVGVILKKIHGIKMPGFGRLKLEVGKLIGSSKDYKQGFLIDGFYGVNSENLNYLIANSFIDSAGADKIQKVFDEILAIKLDQASFLHEDVGPQHIFTDGAKVTGLIDMDAVSAGDPRLDLAISRYYFPAQFWPAIAHGYGPESADPVIGKYFLLVAVRKVIYRHKHKYFDRMPSALEMLDQILKTL